MQYQRRMVDKAMVCLWPLAVLKAWLFAKVKSYSLEALTDLHFALLARRSAEQVLPQAGAVRYRLQVPLTI